jgi:hypothetical protein
MFSGIRFNLLKIVLAPADNIRRRKKIIKAYIPALSSIISKQISSSHDPG